MHWHTLPEPCGSNLAQQGAIALRAQTDGFTMAVARRAGEERPWPMMPQPQDGAQAPARLAPREATPRVDDLEIGD